jgi:hypothetical protein
MEDKNPKNRIEIRSLNRADFSEVSCFQELEDDVASEVYGGLVCGQLATCGTNSGPCPSLTGCDANTGGSCTLNFWDGCPRLYRCGNNTQ